MRDTSVRLLLVVLAAGSLMGCGDGKKATQDAGTAPRGRLRVTEKRNEFLPA
jgi:hypothetical protein